MAGWVSTLIEAKGRGMGWGCCGGEIGKGDAIRNLNEYNDFIIIILKTSHLYVFLTSSSLFQRTMLLGY